MPLFSPSCIGSSLASFASSDLFISYLLPSENTYTQIDIKSSVDCEDESLDLCTFAKLKLITLIWFPRLPILIKNCLPWCHDKMLLRTWFKLCTPTHWSCIFSDQQSQRQLVSSSTPDRTLSCNFACHFLEGSASSLCTFVPKFVLKIFFQQVLLKCSQSNEFLNRESLV